MLGSNSKRFRGFILLAPLLISVGCATMTRSSRQRIPVTSAPAGATVFVNGQLQGVTPLELKLSKSGRGRVIRIEFPGYNPVEIRLAKKTSGALFLSNILLGLIPAVLPATYYSLSHDGKGFMMTWTLSAAALGALFTAVDSGSGAIYDIEPREIIVTLKKVSGTPRVDTMLIDADEFRNIKWIRVRRNRATPPNC
jgi:hypothetical protein